MVKVPFVTAKLDRPMNLLNCERQSELPSTPVFFEVSALQKYMQAAPLLHVMLRIMESIGQESVYPG